MRKILFFMFVCLLVSIIPSYASSQIEEEETVVSVTFEADVPNGLTDNVTFELLSDADGDSEQIFLYRMNGFKARTVLLPGHYTLHNINTYIKGETIKDMEFDVTSSDSEKEIVIKVSGGKKKNETVNRKISDIKGITPSPKPTYSPKATEKVYQLMDVTPPPQKTDDSFIHTDLFKKILVYGLGILAVIGGVWGYKKLKQMWNS